MRLIAATALAGLLASPLAAETQCAPPPVAVQFLVGTYGQKVVETVEAPAPGSDLMVVWQMWVNAETETWTFTGTANGRTCLFRSGGWYRGHKVADFLLGEPS